MTLKYCAAFTLLLLAIGSKSAPSSTEGLASLPHAQYLVSLVDLIVRPEEFKKGDAFIQVSGFLGKRATLYLFLTEEHEQIDDTASAVPFHLDDSEQGLASSNCVGRFVSVIGQFKRDRSGQFGLSHIVQVSVPGEQWGRQPCWQADKSASR